MKYKRNWKYEVNEYIWETCTLGITKDYLHQSGLFIVTSIGVGVSPGYHWDGPSGPTIDTADSMLGSLIHDVLYQTLREAGDIGLKRKVADKLFLTLLKREGMWWLKRNAWYLGVRAGGKRYTKPARMRISTEGLSNWRKSCFERAVHKHLSSYHVGPADNEGNTRGY